MQNGRDSSVWRSLAVAFGDGVAFGVGMKLTQNAARGPAAAEPAGPLAVERLDEIDRRIARLERAPAAAPAAEAPGFDRKVMEAVVNAVDVRLREHAAQVDRVIADLERRIKAAAAAAADSAVDQRMDAMRADLRASAGEVADLRRRADESARNVLDLLLAMGQMCRETAAAMSPSPGPRAVDDAAPEEPAADPDPPAGPAADAPPETPAPEFGQLQRPRPWRVPLVSSLVVTSGVLALGLMRLL